MEEFFASVDPSTTIVTGTSRLARHLTERYSLWQMDQGSESWETPDVLPWTIFVDRAWREWVARDPGAAAGLIVLRPSQEQALWERVIRESLPDDEKHLYQVPATARAAAAAYRVARNWQISDDAIAMPSAPEDVRQFARWARAFDRHCERHQLLPLANATRRLIEWCESHRPPRIEKLYYAGFDQVSPAQQQLIDSLQRCGVHVAPLASEPFAATAQQISFATRADESRAAARWARRVLEAQPDARIGIVAPDLDAVRNRIAADLSNAIDSGNTAPHAGGRSSLFHLSLGAPLGEAPVVAAGLAALQLLVDPVDVNTLGQLLRSPFFTDAESERDGRARLDLALRRDGQDRISLRDFVWFAAEFERTCELAPALGARARDMLSSRDELAVDAHARRSATEWAQIFTQWHRTCGWGGGRELDSEEFQAREAYNDLISDFCALDLVVDRMMIHEAITQLERLATERIHQPRARAAPVQVMGVIESGGLAFSHLWLLGMTDDVWPAPAQPNPFLPVSVQREVRLATSEAGLSLAQARDITERLVTSAEHVVVSYATADGDTALRLSPLFTALPTASAETLRCAAVSERVEQLIDAAPVLQELADHRAPELTIAAPGGTGIFRDQSNCGFRAFAIHRLNARAPGRLSSGLDPSERGQLVHDVMDQFWNAIGDQAALKRLMQNDTDLEIQVRSAVEAAVDQRARMQRLKYSDAVREIETERMVRMTLDWLEVEAKRPPFRIESVEDDQEYDVEGISVTMRIDRVDRLADNRRFIIDYKTGAVKVADWEGDRPRDPQLLVYASALGVDSIAAMGFARLRSGESEFVGLADESAAFDKIKVVEKTRFRHEFESFDDVLTSTNDIVASLARQFREGNAEVDPLDNACTYCELTSLCRFHELVDEDSSDGESA